MLHFIVQPVFVWDDGDELELGPATDPMPMTMTQLRALPDRMPAEISRLEGAIDLPPDSPPMEPASHAPEST